MAISLLVLLLPVAVVVALFRARGGEDVVVIDPSSAIADAQTSALPVAVPRGLADGWRPVSASFRRGTDGVVLRIGYLTPSGGAVQLIESNEPTDGLLVRELGDQTRPAGTVTVGDRRWDKYGVRGNETALVWILPDRTVIAIGRAPSPELEFLAAAVS